MALKLLHISLYNLYAFPLVGDKENFKNQKILV